jgi:protoporphyrinogen oxidase
MRAKWGSYADQVSAVWFWNKLKLRGGSRSKQQSEQLGYLRGGFQRLISGLEERLRQRGAEICLSSPVSGVRVEGGRAIGVVSNGEFRSYDRVLVTASPEVLAELAPDLPDDYQNQLRQIEYLANTCLVLALKHHLSPAYWLNIGDPAIPFVALIEHTNLRSPSEYGGHHLVYLSRYMAADDPFYAMGPDELFNAYLPHLEQMFPHFGMDWVDEVYFWSARYTQPVIVRHYSDLRPAFQTPLRDLWLSCMAQVYPEDRGMNYAVVYGQRVAEMMLADINAR